MILAAIPYSTTPPPVNMLKTSVTYNHLKHRNCLSSDGVTMFTHPHIETKIPELAPSLKETKINITRISPRHPNHNLHDWRK
jgi:hypothetical protein